MTKIASRRGGCLNFFFAWNASSKIEVFRVSRGAAMAKHALKCETQTCGPTCTFTSMHALKPNPKEFTEKKNNAVRFSRVVSIFECGKFERKNALKLARSVYFTKSSIIITKPPTKLCEQNDFTNFQQEGHGQHKKKRETTIYSWEAHFVVWLLWYACPAGIEHHFGWETAHVSTYCKIIIKSTNSTYRCRYKRYKRYKTERKVAMRPQATDGKKKHPQTSVRTKKRNEKYFELPVEKWGKRRQKEKVTCSPLSKVWAEMTRTWKDETQSVLVNQQMISEMRGVNLMLQNCVESLACKQKSVDRNAKAFTVCYQCFDGKLLRKNQLQGLKMNIFYESSPCRRPGASQQLQDTRATNGREMTGKVWHALLGGEVPHIQLKQDGCFTDVVTKFPPSFLTDELTLAWRARLRTSPMSSCVAAFSDVFFAFVCFRARLRLFHCLGQQSRRILWRVWKFYWASALRLKCSRLLIEAPFPVGFGDLSHLSLSSCKEECIHYRHRYRCNHYRRRKTNRHNLHWTADHCLGATTTRHDKRSRFFRQSC